MVIRTYKMAFWVVWDHLGVFMVVNACAVLGVMLPGSVAFAALLSGDSGIMLLLGLPLTLLIAGGLVPVFAVGIAALAKECIETQEGSFRTFLAGMRRHGLRAALAAWLLCSIGLCLAISAWFYAAQVGPVHPWIGYALSALALWTLLFVCLCVPLVVPALVQRKGSVLAIGKLSAALAVDNPALACSVAAGWGALIALSTVPPLLVVLTPAAAIVLSASAYELLARKYARAGEADTEERRRALDAADDYLNRGWRDLLFPWKS